MHGHIYNTERVYENFQKITQIALECHTPQVPREQLKQLQVQLLLPTDRDRCMDNSIYPQINDTS